MEYALPGGEMRRSFRIGGSISSVMPVADPIPALAIGLRDGSIVIYNPEGEK